MQTLLELKKDLEVELELMNEFARENLKSYQVWYVPHLQEDHPGLSTIHDFQLSRLRKKPG